MENQKSYYAIIPASVRYDKEIPANAKLLYGEITALCNEKGYCWATNSYFAELYGVSKTSISSWVSLLVNKGYISIEITYKEGTKEIEKRIIKLNTPYTKNFVYPIQENLYTPIQENLKENNTVINNTIESINNNKTNMNNNTNKSNINLIIDFYNNNIGQLTRRGLEYLEAYLDDFDEDVIVYAMELAVKNNARTINYITAILDNWKKSDLRNLAEIKNKKKEKQETKMTGRNYTDDFFNSFYAN